MARVSRYEKWRNDMVVLPNMVGDKKLVNESEQITIDVGVFEVDPVVLKALQCRMQAAQQMEQSY